MDTELWMWCRTPSIHKPDPGCFSYKSGCYLGSVTDLFNLGRGLAPLTS